MKTWKFLSSVWRMQSHQLKVSYQFNIITGDLSLLIYFMYNFSFH